MSESGPGTGVPTQPEVVRRAHPERSAPGMAVKRLVQAAAAVWVLPRLLVYGLARPVWGRDRAFASASESIGRLAGMRGVYLRQAFYRSTLAACGRDVYFGWLCAFSTPLARVGEGAYIGRRCGVGWAEIGAGALLADGVQVLSGGRQHGTDAAAGASRAAEPQEYRRVALGAGCWIGAGAVVMAEVGEGAVVGAGAVVARPVPARSDAVGVPARVVRELDGGPSTSGG